MSDGPGGSEIGVLQPPNPDLRPTKESPQKQRHCLVLSGFSATTAGINEIKGVFETQYGGAENVRTFNSAVNFKDPQNPNRFNEMADFIEAHAKDGLDIVAHSFGAAELTKAMSIIRKRDEAFFDKKENAQNLRIVLISPGGFNEGFSGPFRYLTRVMKFAREQAEFPIYSKSETLPRGIDALTAFPPKDIESSVLAQAMREAIPELSQYREEAVKMISLDEQRDNVTHLSEDQKEQVAVYGEMMRIAIENRNYDGLKRLIASYGKILRSPLNAILVGSFDSAKNQALEAAQGSIRAMVGGIIGSIKSVGLVFDVLGSAPMKELAELQKKGVDMEIVLPENDLLMRLDQAIAFLEGTGKLPHVVERATHFFPALQALGFGKMIDNLGKPDTS